MKGLSLRKIEILWMKWRHLILIRRNGIWFRLIMIEEARTQKMITEELLPRNSLIRLAGTQLKKIRFGGY